jgi:hypothetical protein
VTAFETTDVKAFPKRSVWTASTRFDDETARRVLS